MRNIALFLPNWIGDVVMATPAIRAVREQYPQANLYAVCKPYVAATLEGSPWFAETILYDRKGPSERREISVIRQLRRRRVDAAILFPNSFRAALIAMLGRCRRRVGFVRYGRRWLLTDRLNYLKDEHGKPKPCPVIDDYNKLAVKLGTGNPGHRMQLFTTATDELAADAVWNDFGFNRFPEVIGLNSSGAFGAAKLWPTAYFAELARHLAERRGAAVLVICGPNERDTAKAIVAAANHPNVVSVADRPVSIGLTKACIKRLDLFVTTDSGPRHFAAAFNRPVVSLFGPTHIEWTETYFPLAINLQKKVPCGPCQLRVCPTDHRCMTDLTVMEVLAASEELLKRDTPRRVRLVG